MSSLYEQIKIQRHGIKNRRFREMYYSVLRMSWSRFFLLLAAAYLIINTLFSFLYLSGGDCIGNAEPGSIFDAFNFSVQTFATIGYGHLLPQTAFAHILVVLESLSGIVFTALITGLTFAKFSRPTPHVIFSNKAIISSYDGVPTLMFRLGNGRENSIVDAKISVVTLKETKTSEGHTMQRFVDVKLERDQSPFFLLTWSVMHKIDETSPFYGFTKEDFKKNNVSLYVSLIGYDEIYSQTIHAGFRYKPSEIQFSKKFVDVIEILPDGGRKIDFTKFHDVEV